MREDLTRADSHFAFGKNWASYAEKIGEAEIAEAERGLLRLVGGRLEGLRLIDIGSGSGLHALAALRLGAREVLAVDIDPDSVATTRAVLERHAPHAGWRAIERSVFDLDPAETGTFDIVYSWGVLHHTGAMQRAIHQASALVKPGGLLVFALYRRIWMDGFWRVVKRGYSRAGQAAQSRARGLYRALFRIGLMVTGRSFETYVSGYVSQRGMDFDHDVHDWMGGWPYESISPPEVASLMQREGFRAERVFARDGRWAGRDLGVFGSGCDEYVYRKR